MGIKNNNIPPIIAIVASEKMQGLKNFLIKALKIQQKAVKKNITAVHRSPGVNLPRSLNCSSIMSLPPGIFFSSGGLILVNTNHMSGIIIITAGTPINSHFVNVIHIHRFVSKNQRV